MFFSFLLFSPYFYSLMSFAQEVSLESLVDKLCLVKIKPTDLIISQVLLVKQYLKQIVQKLLVTILKGTHLQNFVPIPMTPEKTELTFLCTVVSLYSCLLFHTICSIKLIKCVLCHWALSLNYGLFLSACLNASIYQTHNKSRMNI